MVSKAKIEYDKLWEGTMNIHNSKPRLLRYLDKNGTEVDREHAAECGLVKDGIYQMLFIDVHAWHSTVQIKCGKQICHLNSVMFAEVEDQKNQLVVSEEDK